MKTVLCFEGEEFELKTRDEWEIRFRTIAQAKKKLKLDRRVKWSVWDGKLCRTVWETVACSGCSEHYDTGQLIGSWGCSECGYTGKSRRPFPIPYETKDKKFVAIQQSPPQVSKTKRV